LENDAVELGARSDSELRGEKNISKLQIRTFRKVS
jgi:hypothetical protein